MATATTTGLNFPACSNAHSVSQTRREGRRYITPESGRALELLGHAIEYLTDELIHEGKRVTAHNPQVEAIQLLMALNRQVYFDCPVIPTPTQRLLRFLSFR